MWQLYTPWYEPLMRGFVLYIFVFLLVRLMGKKQLAKFTPFDLVLLLVISGPILNTIEGSDHSIPATLISVGTLVLLNIILNQLRYHFNWFEKLLLGQPKVLILNGKIHKKVMRKERITETDIYEALREHEIMKMEDVKCAILETDGKISVIKYNSHH